MADGAEVVGLCAIEVDTCFACGDDVGDFKADVGFSVSYVYCFGVGRVVDDRDVLLVDFFTGCACYAEFDDLRRDQRV